MVSWARIAVLAASMSIVALLHGPLIGAEEVRGCVERSPRGYCVEWDVSRAVGPRPSLTLGGTAPNCHWVTVDKDLAKDPTVWADFGLERPPAGRAIAWQSWECADGRMTFDFRWVLVATPADLASLARGRLVGELAQPAVESSPPVGTASIVGVPVFVMVTNWTGVASASECAGGLCVTVTATPQMHFAPGEPDSGSLACRGSGSRYVPGGGRLDVLASARGACAWPYRLRTGAAGRPSAWPGEVSVTWSLAWTATSGASGTLPAVTRSTIVPRSVAEVQTVVAGGATP